MLRAAGAAGVRCNDCDGDGLALREQKELVGFRGTAWRDQGSTPGVNQVSSSRHLPREGSCCGTAASPSPFVALLTQFISQALRQAACRGGGFLQQLWAQDAASRLFQSASCCRSPGPGCAGARGRDSGPRNVLWS